MTEDEKYYMQEVSKLNKEVNQLTKKLALRNCSIFLLVVFLGLLLYGYVLMQGKLTDMSEEVTYYQELYEESL
jgi:hypothetical protein